MKEINLKKKVKNSTRMGFEPTRAEHNGLAVHRLNHSATSSHTHFEIHEQNFKHSTGVPYLSEMEMLCLLQ